MDGELKMVIGGWGGLSQTQDGSSRKGAKRAEDSRRWTVNGSWIMDDGNGKP